jgi:RimJ/RimL family protein N-acetyltransferase
MYKIREAALPDAPALHEHLTAVFSERLPTLFARPSLPSPETVRDRITENAASPNSVLLVAEAQDRIIGTLDFEGYRRPQQRHAGSFGMSVRREHRGKGVGTALISGLASWAPRNGVSRLELGVFVTNANAIRLYERLGFEHEGCRVGAVIVEGQPVDILQMARRLAA